MTGKRPLLVTAAQADRIRRQMNRSFRGNGRLAVRATDDVVSLSDLRRPDEGGAEGGGSATETVIIVGYEDIGEHVNAAFSCKRFDDDGDLVGEAFRVRARSSGTTNSATGRMQEDLAKCAFPTVVGDWIDIEELRVKLPNGNVRKIKMWRQWAHLAGCENAGTGDSTGGNPPLLRGDGETGPPRALGVPDAS